MNWYAFFHLKMYFWVWVLETIGYLVSTFIVFTSVRKQSWSRGYLECLDRMKKSEEAKRNWRER